ncbi:MAG TPA: ABC-F family ATP-binding cassette domain-containing protein [Nitriliruptorales bacterium]
MITVSSLSKSFGAQTVLRDVSLRVLPGQRVAIVGANGAGKTTLLRILAGLDTPDEGEVAVDRGVTFGYLEQEVTDERGRPVLDAVLDGAVELRRIQARLTEVERELEGGATDERLLDEYGHLQDRFGHLGGYDVESRAHRVLAGLGFAPDDADRDVGELSGGWMIRVALARLLLAHPDVLLLDEPTNHLDVESAAWLENFLREYDGAVVLVSHDRTLIQAVANVIAEVVRAEVDVYAGDWDWFVEQRDLRLQQAIATRRNQDAKVAQLQEFVDRFRYKKTKAKQAQAKLTQIGRIEAEKVTVPKMERKKARFGFPPPPRSGRVVAELDGVAKRYGDTVVYDHLDLVLERGQKVALVGPNGAGKSTLLKLLVADVGADAGRIELGHNVEVAYYAQHQADQLTGDKSVLAEFLDGLSDEERRRLDPRRILGAFLFRGDEVDKPVDVLSGGERARLALAKLMVRPANLLCLDEPTNHLDIVSRDVLEEALSEYQGTVVLITHDRHLIGEVADTIVDVRAGRASVYPGTWEEYLWRTGREADQPPSGGAPTSRRSGPAAVHRPQAAPDPEPAEDPDARKERKRRQAELRNRLYRETKPLRDKVLLLETQLARTEDRVAELNRILADPAVYEDEVRVKELVAEHNDAKERGSSLMAQWEAAQLELDRVTGHIEAELGV